MKNQDQNQVLKKKIIATFKQFDPQDQTSLDEFYDSKAVFEDPVAQVQGLGNIKDYYRKAFKNVKSIQWDFKDITTDGETFSAPWTMTIAVQGLNFGKPYAVQGVSIMKFNDKKRVVYHRDYLDLGEMVYEQIPVFGKALTLFKSLLK